MMAARAAIDAAGGGVNADRFAFLFPSKVEIVISCKYIRELFKGKAGWQAKFRAAQ